MLSDYPNSAEYGRDKDRIWWCKQQNPVERGLITHDHHEKQVPAIAIKIRRE
jgi:hypothetical protein